MATLLTVAEVKKTLQLIDACEVKSKKFVNMVRKHGFSKAYKLFVEKSWECDTMEFDYKVLEKLDVIYPLDDLFYELNPGTADAMRSAMDKKKTAKAFIKSYSAERIAKLAKRFLKKKLDEKEQ
jgi:hypothetical protein